MSEVAGAILYSSGAATKLLDSLVRAGLVVRESSPDDRRTVWAALTPAGKDLFVKAGRQHVEGIKREFAAYLRDDELEPVHRFLQRLADPAANAN